MNNVQNELNVCAIEINFLVQKNVKTKARRRAKKKKKKKQNQQTLKTEYIKYRSTHSVIHMNIFVYGMPYETNSNMIHCETK